jgi:anti-sigma regulatory factor (Ser/Thr protein kinase)
VRGAADGFPETVVDDLALLVSELVTNVVLHANTELTVRMSCSDAFVHVEVSDCDPRPPVVSSGRGSAGGYGMQLVVALARRWGVTSDRCGKTVWFDVDCQV